MSAAGDEIADDFLGVPLRVDVGGVDEISAAAQEVVDDRVGLGDRRAPAPVRPEGHRAEAEGADAQSRASECHVVGKGHGAPEGDEGRAPAIIPRPPIMRGRLPPHGAIARRIMQPLAAGISYFDLNFQDRARVIACGVLHDAGGVVLVDPGPSSTLPTLRQSLASAGIGIADVTTILLTHIHLDHAGATGTLVRENPRLRVYVHEVGAPHLVDPSRLVASASRLYADAMERLWGEVAPVPRESLEVLQGGERIRAGGRMLDVAYTPGHASHHVSYFSAETGVAFVGDTAGVRLVPGAFVMPPTPPPDIDLESWRDSLSIIEGVARRHAADHAFRRGRIGRAASGRAARSPGCRRWTGESVAGHRRGRRGPGSVVRAPRARRSAAPAGGFGSGALRGCRPVRPELARPGEVLEKARLTTTRWRARPIPQTRTPRRASDRPSA